MSTFWKVIVYAVGIFTLYSLMVTFIHMPVFGVGSFLFPFLLLCPLMFLFMGHGEHSGKKKSGHVH